MSNDVKILYCKDENDNVIFYRDIIKGQKYYCLDCGEELSVKNGKVKIKHLAHKNNSNCTSLGESFIHKHYKENYFIPGMVIDTEEYTAEILKVLTEVELGKYYNIELDRKVIVDTLLITDRGDIVIEFYFTHKKEWDEYINVYAKLDILDVFEIDIDININNDRHLTWHSAKEELRMCRERNKNKKNNLPQAVRFFVGRYSIPIKIDSSVYEMECYTQETNDMEIYSLKCLKKCKVRFFTRYGDITEHRLRNKFPQPWLASFEAKVYQKYSKDVYEIFEFENPKPYERINLKDTIPNVDHQIHKLFNTNFFSSYITYLLRDISNGNLILPSSAEMYAEKVRCDINENTAYKLAWNEKIY